MGDIKGAEIGGHGMAKLKIFLGSVAIVVAIVGFIYLMMLGGGWQASLR